MSQQTIPVLVTSGSMGSGKTTVLYEASDILAEVAPDRVPGSLGLAGVEIGLSALFGSRKLDLRAVEELSGNSRLESLDTAEVPHAQG